MIETDTLLEKCPRCGTWPMAASVLRTGSAQAEIRFRCPRCHAEEAGRLRRAVAPHPRAQRDLNAA